MWTSTENLKASPILKEQSGESEYLGELTDPLAIIFKIWKKGLPEAKIVFSHISNFVI